MHFRGNTPPAEREASGRILKEGEDNQFDYLKEKFVFSMASRLSLRAGRTFQDPSR
jgi:hypothetical protein